VDEREAKEFQAMAAKARQGELLADFDPAQYPCQLLAWYFYSLLAMRDAA
jgi:hypothetical protein